MCLYSNNKDPFIAKENIKCFKVVIPNLEGGFTTPCIGAKYKYNSLIKATGYPDIRIMRFPRYDLYVMDIGFIHVFSDLFSALCLKDELPLKSKPKIIKCIIKKNTPYYTNVTNTEMCAKEIYITDKFVD